MEKSTIAVSEFKATCLGVIEEVRRTGHSIVITKHGVPVAELVPIADAKKPRNWLGCMAGTARILGDIEGPAIELEEWEALR